MEIHFHTYYYYKTNSFSKFFIWALYIASALLYHILGSMNDLISTKLIIIFKKGKPSCVSLMNAPLHILKALMCHGAWDSPIPNELQSPVGANVYSRWHSHLQLGSPIHLSSKCISLDAVRTCDFPAEKPSASREFERGTAHATSTLLRLHHCATLHVTFVILILSSA